MVELQHVPSTSTAVPAPLHTPQESRVPSGQHHPAPSRALPSSQQATFLSSTPDKQHCCCASTTPLLQFAATCANSTQTPYSGMCNGTAIKYGIKTCVQLSQCVSKLDVRPLDDCLMLNIAAVDALDRRTQTQTQKHTQGVTRSFGSQQCKQGCSQHCVATQRSTAESCLLDASSEAWQRKDRPPQ